MDAKNKSGKFITQEQMMTLSVLLSRAQLSAKMGLQYGTDRDLYQALGYKTTLQYSDYAVKYTRQDIAKAVINRPVEVTWRDGFELVESDDENETELEKAWNQLYEKFRLKEKFSRLDKLACLGNYGILLVGMSDVKVPEDMQKPVSGTVELTYLKPLSQDNAKVYRWDDSANSPRYGMPDMYEITIKRSTGDGSTDAIISTQIRVHFSRVIHVTGELLESEVQGVPALEAVYNRLDDLEKLMGGSAEMFWRGARPGVAGEVDKDFTLTPSAQEDLQTQIDEFEHNLRRLLVLQGIKLNPLAMQVADPQQHVDAQIQMISAVTGIPKRILTGSERGELASSEDRSTWLELIKMRQRDYAEAQIVRPFVDLCMANGILPDSSASYSILWPDLFAPSDKERADVGKVRADAVQAYSSNPDAQLILPPDSFLEYCLGLEAEDIELISEQRDAAIMEEVKELQDQLAEQEAAVQAQPKPTPGQKQEEETE